MTKKTPRQLANSIVVELIEAADMGGAHYAPDLRDCLNDHALWVSTFIRNAIETNEADNAQN